MDEEFGFLCFLAFFLPLNPVPLVVFRVLVGVFCCESWVLCLLCFRFFLFFFFFLLFEVR